MIIAFFDSYPQKAIALPTSQNSDRPPTPQKRSPSHIPNSDRPHIPKKRTACSSASLSPPHPKQRTACSSASLSPSQPQTAIALSHPKQRSHSPHPQKDIALPHPKQRTDKSVLALSHPHIPQKAIALPTSPKTANCLQQRFAIALSHSQKRYLWYN
jgi:hypothetical protein